MILLLRGTIQKFNSRNKKGFPLFQVLSSNTIEAIPQFVITKKWKSLVIKFQSLFLVCLCVCVCVCVCVLVCTDWKLTALHGKFNFYFWLNLIHYCSKRFFQKVLKYFIQQVHIKFKIKSDSKGIHIATKDLFLSFFLSVFAVFLFAIHQRILKKRKINKLNK